MSGIDPLSLQGKPPEEAPTEKPQVVVRTATGVSGGQPTKSVPKNIFVCCDGTGNEFAPKDSLNGNSNVVKFYTALNLCDANVAYYHPGVGTMGDPTKDWAIAKWWSAIKGLAFGRGFRENVLDAYRYLMQHYASGDRVFILGFSRGAYTARALAGLLHGYGLLCRGNEGHIPYAWRMYTELVATEKELNAHTIQTDTTFRDTFSHKDFSIYFVGLWDTVSSVGWITAPLRLLDMAQNSTIERGRHAVSIDERRCFYQDNLWGKPVEVANTKPPREQDMLQVWFAGVHSDVGGSYPQLQSGLSNITLQWMIDETRTAAHPLGGEIFDESRVRMVLGTPGPDEPTAATAALAPMYEKPKSSRLHRSLHGIWWLLEIFPHRYYDKDDSSVKMRVPLGAYRAIPRGSVVHPSVKDRFKTHACYKPKNISEEEIVPGAAPCPAGYLQFAPKVCRDNSFRQQWLFVFVVKVLELGAALGAIVWTAEWTFRRIRPLLVWVAAHLWVACRWWLGLQQYVIGHWFSRSGRYGEFLWMVLIASVIVMLHQLFLLIRRVLR